jgi:hypothetical protein
MKDEVDLQDFNNYAKQRVEEIISGSPDMITALECVGAMYGIPPTHLTVEPELKSLRVVDDHIMAPPDVRPNTKAIVCSIGGVLDHISQRINDKLDDRHGKESLDGREQHVSPTSDPNKGEVIKRYIDANGDEVVVYDSGLMDMANTKEAHLKADELKKDGKVPEFHQDDFNKKKNSYFTKEDAIELSTEAWIDPVLLIQNQPLDIDIPNTIQESAFHIGLLSQYHDTDFLGYQLLQDQGFDYVRPTESFTLEADEEKSTVNPSDIKHMKFDNTHITNAIKCFNEARDEQSDKGKGEFDLTAFISSAKYKEGINELEKQFDCKLSVHFKDDIKESDKNNLFTFVFDHLHTDKIYVSKSKGFQLNGLPITICCVNKAIDEEMTKDADKNLFGQFMCASLCHEIFHNIANAIRCRTNMFIYTSTSAIAMALSTENEESRDTVFSKFADTIVVDGDHLNEREKKDLVKKLSEICEITENKEDMEKLTKAMDSKSMSEADQQIEALIVKYEKAVKTYEKKIPHLTKKGDKYLKNPTSHKILNKLATGLTCTLIGAPIGLPMLKLLPSRSDAALAQAYHEYLNKTNKEEYYCDMFAGMYNLPLTFTYGYTNRDFAANAISTDKLDYLNSLEKKLRQFTLSPYPTNSERNYAAYQIAKQILSGEEKISPEVKRYCEWICDNYSSITKTSIEKDYNHTTFDPNESKDLDKHTQDLIVNNNINVTEFYRVLRGDSYDN